jgi:hypothetical protein
MFRRSFLKTASVVSTLPLVPDRLSPNNPPAIPSERNVLFWYHFYSTTQRDRPMSTERARRQTVSEVALEDSSEEKAAHLLRLANDGVYEIADIPECRRGAFEEMEQKLRHRVTETPSQAGDTEIRTHSRT